MRSVSVIDGTVAICNGANEQLMQAAYIYVGNHASNRMCNGMRNHMSGQLYSRMYSRVGVCVGVRVGVCVGVRVGVRVGPQALNLPDQSRLPPIVEWLVSVAKS